MRRRLTVLVLLAVLALVWPTVALAHDQPENAKSRWVMADRMLDSIHLLARVSNVFVDKLLDGLEVNRERCEALIEQSLMMVTSLAPEIGYESAAKLAKEAFASGKTIRQLCTERKLMSEKRLDELLDPMSVALILWLLQYRTTRQRPGIYPVDRFGGYTTELAGPATRFFVVLATFLAAFAVAIIVGHLIWGQKF